MLREINGTGPDGKALSSYTELKDDGTTTAGCWIYTGVYADEVNQSDRRKPGREQNWVAPEWGWAWPANRRTLYNRASADPEGKPWSERKAYVWWDEETQRGGRGTTSPTSRPPSRRPTVPSRGQGSRRHQRCGRVHHAERRQGLAVRADRSGRRSAAHALRARRVAGAQALYRQQANPGREVIEAAWNRANPPASDVYPYVFTTYRLTEHHTAGGMSRTLPYLSELQPEFFVEVSPQLAEERGLENGGWATLVSARTAIEAKVLVTERMRPLKVGQGKVVHQIGVPYHWGEQGISTGDSGNDLFGVVMDPNVHIQESKVATCDIQPGRRPRGPRWSTWWRPTAARRREERRVPVGGRSPVEETNMTGEQKGQTTTTQSRPDHVAEGTP